MRKHVVLCVWGGGVSSIFEKKKNQFTFVHSCVRPPAGFRVPGLGRAVRQAEHTGHRLQQAQSQDGQEEAAVRVQGRAQGCGGERQMAASTFVFLFSGETQTHFNLRLPPRFPAGG